MVPELRTKSPSGIAVPEVAGERCVHALMETASCRACADACPREAWAIDDAALGIDTDKCDGCDLCVPACPQGAIEGRFSASIQTTELGGVAFAVCEHAGVESIEEGWMPCLHALGLTQLLQLRRDGTGLLVTSCGDCEGCGRGGAVRIEQRLAEVNRLLASRGSEPLRHRPVAADAWARALRHTRELAAARPLNRRAFFRDALRRPKERVEAAIDDSASAFVPPGMLLEVGAADALFPLVPEIDPERCNGCDACVRLCPQGAILLETPEHGDPAFLIHAERCSGCGTCTDVCEQSAASIKRMDRPVEVRIPLQAKRCRACGTHYHMPAAGTDRETLCWVCSRSDRYGNLYQILD